MKKITALFSALVMLLLSLTSCGGGGDDYDPTRVRAVSISQSALTLTDIGETFELTASVIPSTAEDHTITWTSSDDSVATCENGLVTAVGYGVAIIRATAIGGASATCTVDVPNPAPNLSLSDIEISINAVGGIYRLRAYDINGADVTEDVVWTTTNDDIATCESGVVTAVSFGYCTIRASVKSGHYAECFVKVVDPAVKLPTLSKNEIKFDTVGGTDTISVKNAEGQVTWMSSNDEIVTCENGAITAVAEGIAVIIAVDENLNTDACIVYVGEYENPKSPEDLLDFEIKDLPKLVHYVNELTGQKEASALITSYTLEWETEEDGTLLVSVIFNMVKVYDAHGYNSGDSFYITAGFYTENDYMVTTLPYVFTSVPLGSEFIIGQRVRFIMDSGVKRQGYIAFLDYVER